MAMIIARGTGRGRRSEEGTPGAGRAGDEKRAARCGAALWCCPGERAVPQGALFRLAVRSKLICTGKATDCSSGMVSPT